MSHGHALSQGAVLIIAMLMSYMVMGSIIERYNLPFGHEASFTILIGMFISFISFEQGYEELVELLKFNDETFFFVCLPPIVFASGFNMQRGNFFSNIKNIALFGVVGTFVAFTSFSLMTILVKNNSSMTQFDGKTGLWSALEITNAECMLMCSLLCSSDVIAAISLINYDDQPKLFSIVFGEGITNDAVSIILFNTVMKYTSTPSSGGDNVSNPGVVIDWSTPIAIASNFFALGIDSLLLGLFAGLLSSYVLKSFRMFSKNPVAESCMIFCFGYLSYVVSELVEYSGIITLLTSGIVMAQYTWYNLSPQGKQSSFIIFQFLGYVVEAFVFSYLGLTFFSYGHFKWSLDLFLLELGVILLGRGFGTLGLIGFLKLFGYNSGVNIKELIFIWYAGMIRGAIAFGLVLRIDHSYINRDVIVTTSLSLVVFTTVVFGSTVGILSKCLFKEQVEEGTIKLAEDPVVEELANQDEYDSVDVSSIPSEYSEMQHPNQEGKKSRDPTVYHGCSKYLHRFDELLMKPIFIYKYERNMQKKSKEFFNRYMMQGTELEEEYANEQKQLRENGLRNALVRDEMEQQKKVDSPDYDQKITTQSARKSDSMSASNFISRQLTKKRKPDKNGRTDSKTYQLGFRGAKTKQYTKVDETKEEEAPDGNKEQKDHYTKINN